MHALVAAKPITGSPAAPARKIAPTIAEKKIAEERVSDTRSRFSNGLRTRELAKIHIAAKQLGMDDAAYRDMLWTVARVRSAKELDAAGRARVLDHLKACGFKGKRGRPHPGRPHNADSAERGGQMGKIEALLAAKKRAWAYADGMAQRMYRVERVAWCNPEQLQGIIAALVYDANRHSSEPGCVSMNNDGAHRHKCEECGARLGARGPNAAALLGHTAAPAVVGSASCSRILARPARTSRSSNRLPRRADGR